MLKLENISWSAPGGVGVLNGLDLEIPDGKLVVITGPNGGGKTTLAKIIAGIYKQDSGRILLNDSDITDKGITERAKMGISFAFQQPVRFKGITVKRLIELASGNKMNDNELCDILSKVGLCAREYINREVDSTLSGGEIKRIEIATVLARQTQITIFDEPEAGIDLWSFSSLSFRSSRRQLTGVSANLIFLTRSGFSRYHFPSQNSARCLSPAAAISPYRLKRSILTFSAVAK